VEVGEVAAGAAARIRGMPRLLEPAQVPNHLAFLLVKNSGRAGFLLFWA